MTSQNFHLFQDADELAQFAVVVIQSFADAQAVAARSAVAHGDYSKAILAHRLISRMMDYRLDRAEEIHANKDGYDGHAIAADLEAIWPIFRDVVDENLTETGEMLDQLHGALDQRPK